MFILPYADLRMFWTTIINTYKNTYIQYFILSLSSYCLPYAGTVYKRKSEKNYKSLIDTVVCWSEVKKIKSHPEI